MLCQVAGIEVSVLPLALNALENLQFELGTVSAVLLLQPRYTMQTVARHPTTQLRNVYPRGHRAGIEHMKMQHHTADILARESVTTLTVLLAGMAGGVAYAAKALGGEHIDWISVGAVIFVFYLFVLSYVLVTRCLRITAIPSIFNEPKNLLPSQDLEIKELMRRQLNTLQDCIEEAATRNKKVALLLNKIRLAEVFSPFFFGVGGVLVGLRSVVGIDARVR